jgi:PHP family Zn ribbon phosphoesterase
MTVEFFPEEGKYHWDGHRNCNISMLPAEAIKLGNICPVCKKKLTLGVLHRVEALADRPEGFIPKDAIPFVSLVPLEEIVCGALGKNPGTKPVREEVERILAGVGSEFDVLAIASPEKLRSVANERVAEGILRVRERKIKAEPGFDGVYGKISVFSGEGEKGKKKDDAAFYSGQKGLGEFI